MAQPVFKASQVSLSVSLYPSNHSTIFARAGLPVPTSDTPSPVLFTISCSIFDKGSQDRWFQTTDAERLAYLLEYDSKFPQHKRDVSPHVAMTLSLRGVAESLATVLALPYGWQLIVRDNPEDRVVVSSLSSRSEIAVDDVTMAEFLRTPASSRERSGVHLMLLWPGLELTDHTLLGVDSRSPGRMLVSLIVGMRRQHTPPSPDSPSSSDDADDDGSESTSSHQQQQPQCCITESASDGDGAHILTKELADWRISWTLRGLTDSLLSFKNELPEELRIAVESLSEQRSSAAADTSMDVDAPAAAPSTAAPDADRDGQAQLFHDMISMRGTLFNRLRLRDDLCTAVEKSRLWLLPYSSQAHWVDARKMPNNSAQRVTFPPAHKKAELLEATSEAARVPALMVEAARLAYEKFATDVLHDVFKARAFLVAEALRRRRIARAIGLGLYNASTSSAHLDAVMKEDGDEAEGHATTVDDDGDVHLQGGIATGDDDVVEGDVYALAAHFDECWTVGKAVEVSVQDGPPRNDEQHRRRFVCEAARVATSYARLTRSSAHSRHAGMRALLEHYADIERLAGSVTHRYDEYGSMHLRSLNEDSSLYLECLEDAEVGYDVLAEYFSGFKRWTVSSRQVARLVKKQAADVFFAVWPLMAAGELGDHLTTGSEH